jgi:hypothetical protein
MKWESSSKGTHCSLRCTFQPLTTSEWKDIQTTLSRSAQLKVKILDRQTFWKRNILVLSILSLSLLWAFDPIIATSLLTTHGVPPLFLTSLRFYTVLLFFSSFFSIPIFDEILIINRNNSLSFPLIFLLFLSFFLLLHIVVTWHSKELLLPLIY